MSSYDIEAIRAQVRAKMKKGKDPSEFRAPKVDEGKTVKYRFYILPPLQEGDTCNEGKSVCERSMDLFAISNGAHYIDNKRIGCPRIINEEDCAICEYAFDLLAEIDGTTVEGKKRRSEIGKALLPGQYHLVNLYFPAIEQNPEEVRGKVLWFNAPKTVVDIWLECLYRDDDGGDPDDKLAFGVFFDECSAYQFQLEIVKDGQMNSYKKSKFVGGKRPIAADKTGKKIDSRIAEILAKRHNLWEKMPEVNPEECARVAAALSGRAAAKSAPSGGFDHDEDATASEEAQESAPVAKPAATKPAAAKPAAAAKPTAATAAASSKPTTAAKPAAAATKPATTAKPAAAKAATKPATKPAPKEEVVEEVFEEVFEEAVEEAAEEVVEEQVEELSGEMPAEEEAVEEATEEVAEEAAEEAADDVDGEVDRLLDELNS